MWKKKERFRLDYLPKKRTVNGVEGVGRPVSLRLLAKKEKYVPDDDWMMGDPDGAKIYLNVGGVRHETYLATLKNVEGTRLAKLAEFHEKALNNGVAREGEYFFDRHPGVFQTILDFYRTNELHCPLDVCGGVVRRELKWWGIDEGCFKTCCVTQFSSFTDNEPLLNRLRSQLEAGPAPFGAWVSDIAKDANVRVRIWTALNTPRSSLPAMIYAISAMLVVITSMIGYCLETVEKFQEIENVTCIVDGIAQSRIIHSRLVPLEWVDVACSIFITLELIIKLICAPVKLRFLKSMMTILDILSLIPSLVHMIMFWPHIHCNVGLTTFVNVTMMFRVLRVFRIVYYMRHYGPFRVMLYSIKSAMNAMVMLVVFMAVSVIFFGALVFYAERVSTHETESDNDFRDLTSGFWWAIVTLTTVGYGDLIVRTSLGYATGAVAAVSGLVMLAFVVPIISNQFTMLYNFDIAMKNVHQHCQVKRRKRNLSTSFTFREMRRSSFRSGRTRSAERSKEPMTDNPASGRRRKAFPDADHAPTYSDIDVPAAEFEQCLQNSPGARKRLESTPQSQGGYESDQSSLITDKSKFRGRANTTDSSSSKKPDVANGEPGIRRQSTGVVARLNNNDGGVENSAIGTGSNESNVDLELKMAADKKKACSIAWSQTDGEEQERDRLMDDA
ncbi:potassium voltage-gated channel subfamily C member 1-like isoform X2 [Lineus longissimus]|uniref:potassium voltage-gated channel subfamily C member 1-like isoform X2 n=1 Tax=Lineus longissimus TaxID=88925 RepID=UPI00315DF982